MPDRPIRGATAAAGATVHPSDHETVRPADRIKVSFNLPQADVSVLREIAEQRSTTVTEALRGAIATEKFLREAAARGEKILLEGEDGRVRELVVR